MKILGIKREFLPILILDTPRTGDGLNHRFFVANPNDCEETQVVRWAQQARENALGVDYLAVSRPVAQIYRGQTRHGEELLLYAGISTKDPNRNAALRARLGTILDTIQQGPSMGERLGAGLLLPCSRLEEFQNMLRKCPDVPSAPPEGSERGPRWSNDKIKRGLKMLGMILPPAVVGVFLMAQCDGRAKDKSPTSSRLSEPRLPQAPRDEWSFFQNDSAWKQLARLSGFNGTGPQCTEFKAWAKNLLEEVDPALQLSEVSPSELTQNKRVNDLLNVVRSANQSDLQCNAETVSSKWLELLPPNDRQGIENFRAGLRAFRKKNQKETNPIDVKRILLEWEGQLAKIDRLPKSNPDAVRDLNASHIQFLTQSDVTRFERLRNFFEGDDFATSISKSLYGKDWTKSEWSKRFELLDKLRKDNNWEGPVKNICGELSASLLH
jgi:hypothetical protein